MAGSSPTTRRGPEEAFENDWEMSTSDEHPTVGVRASEKMHFEKTRGKCPWKNTWKTTWNNLVGDEVVGLAEQSQKLQEFEHGNRETEPDLAKIPSLLRSFTSPSLRGLILLKEIFNWGVLPEFETWSEVHLDR